MIFEKSNFEERYNKFWNSEVVGTYNLYTNHPIFTGRTYTFFSSIESLIGKYCESVITVFDNLTRQSAFFEDKDFVASYMRNIKKEVLDDLEEFNPHIKKSASLMKLSAKLEVAMAYVTVDEESDVEMDLEEGEESDSEIDRNDAEESDEDMAPDEVRTSRSAWVI
jgi:hypothetical protein